MRRSPVALATLLLALVPAASASAAGSGGAVAPDASGGTAYGAAGNGPGLVARTFRVTPATLLPGKALTLVFRIDGRVRAAQVRVELVPAESGHAVATLRLGHRRTGRRISVRWRPRLSPGAYTAQLRATAVRARRRAQVTTSGAVRVGRPVVAPAPVPVPVTPTPLGVFPVQGTWNFGGPDARFGAVRAGHVHQGQDVIAAQGTPVVAPMAGTITWTAYQASGAGYYVVEHGADGRDYVFMHFAAGSTAVTKGEVVTAGQRLGSVGMTGDATGPHLHFEVWPDGWYATGSQPIDPLPILQAWAAA
jgi:murein DD-endopeptidase MepM/ murein hydrolase activator NlpD